MNKTDSQNCLVAEQSGVAMSESECAQRKSLSRRKPGLMTEIYTGAYQAWSLPWPWVRLKGSVSRNRPFGPVQSIKGTNLIMQEHRADPVEKPDQNVNYTCYAPEAGWSINAVDPSPSHTRRR